MKYVFEEPKEVKVEFKTKGKFKFPVTVRNCVSIKTGNYIVIRYIAKNNTEHGHRYYHSVVEKVIDNNGIDYIAKGKRS